MNISLKRFIAGIFLLLFLQGCELSAFFFVTPISLNSIPWGEPKELHLKNCPVIDGFYGVIPIERKNQSQEDLLVNLFPLEEKTASKKDYPTWKFSGKFYNDDPYPYKASGEEEVAFYRERLVKIQANERYFSSTLLNRSGKFFRKRSYIFSDPENTIYIEGDKYQRVGCFNNAYIVRSAGSSGCAPGCGKSRTWNERRIQKLPNGNLQITAKGFRQPWFEAQKEETNYTLTFPLYQGKIGDVPADQFEFKIDQQELKGKP